MRILQSMKSCPKRNGLGVVLIFHREDAKFAGKFILFMISIKQTKYIQGRSALTTAFQLFRFMALYSIIQFTSVVLLNFNATFLGNWMYLYQDLWVVFPLVILMGRSRAAASLSRKVAFKKMKIIQNTSLSYFIYYHLETFWETIFATQLAHNCFAHPHYRSFSDHNIYASAKAVLVIKSPELLLFKK